MSLGTSSQQTACNVSSLAGGRLSRERAASLPGRQLWSEEGRGEKRAQGERQQPGTLASPLPAVVWPLSGHGTADGGPRSPPPPGSVTPSRCFSPLPSL